MKIIGTDWEDDLLRRAKAAWFRSGATDQPSSGSNVVEAGKKVYVRLTNARGLMAVYRVRIVNGAPTLKGLRRWPAELE